MEVSDTLLAVLRCPKTQQPLKIADAATLTRIQEKANSCTAALVTEDSSRAYPIDDGYPILLLDAAIELDPS